MRLTRSRAFWYISLIVLYIVTMLNVAFPVVRFEIRALNGVFVIIVLLIPSYLLINGIFFRRTIVKILNSLLWIIPCLMGILLALMIALIWPNSNGFENIDSLNMRSSNIVVYRTNGGATTAFGVEVRQEKRILPGILLVRRTYSQYHKENVELRKVGENSIDIDGKVYQIKSSVYFW